MHVNLMKGLHRPYPNIMFILAISPMHRPTLPEEAFTIWKTPRENEIRKFEMVAMELIKFK